MKNSGFIIVNKPKGLTSHDVIDRLRKITGIKKIGHAGTLDPMATGVLICAVGREFTKRINEFQKLDKQYEAEIKFGGVSNTYDADGEIEEIREIKEINEEEIKDIIEIKFNGEIEQIPPAFSAKKIKGQPAYKLARKGQEVELKPAVVTIHNIEILSYKWPYLRLKIDCSTGTYIRSIAHDLGQILGVGGYLTELARTKIGQVSIAEAIELNKLDSGNWQEYLFDKN